jgi:hypothetical protein
MFPLWATTILSVFLLLFAIPACAMAVAIWCRLIYYLALDLWELNVEQLLGDVIVIIFMGGFATLFGYGAFELGSTVIDGLIGRYANALSG